MVKRGDFVRAFGLTKNGRPGVVLRMLQDPSSGLEYAYIAFTTTKVPPEGKKPVPLCITPSDPLFDELELDDVSWFVVGNADRVRADDERIRVVKLCPSPLLFELLRMYGFK
jgi:hypothetical protein